MGPREDFDATFGRVFGEDGPRPAPPPTFGVSPFAPPARGIADRENFGSGFRRSPGTGAYSPRTRTRCVQDIILRDRGSPLALNNEPVMRYDAMLAPRSSPTYAVTSTTHLKEKNSASYASPKLVTRILPGLEEALKTPRSGGEAHWKQEALKTPRSGGEAHGKRPHTARNRSHSPGLCPPSSHLMGSQLLEASAATPRASSRVSPPPSPQSGPARILKKKGFPDRCGFGNGRVIQQPGVDGGEFADAVTIGDVPVSDNLSLRPDQVDLTKKLLQRRVATGLGVNEWQYRTREIVTMRSKERGKLRWH